MNDLSELRLRDDLLRERQKLADALHALSEAQGVVDKINYRIDYIETLLKSKPGGNESQPAGEIPSHPSRKFLANIGATSTPDWVKQVLKEAGTELKLGEIVDRIMDGGHAGNADRSRIEKNVSSVLHRASRNPNHPLFKKTGRGLFDLQHRN